MTFAISAATVDVQLEAVVETNLLLKGLGLADLIPQFDSNVLATNPHMRHSDSTHNGLAIVEVRADGVAVEFMRVGDVTSRAHGATDSVHFFTPLGSRRVTRRI